MRFNSFLFFKVEIVLGINNLVSEFVKGINDLLNDILVWEVLVAGKGNKGLDHWGEFTTLADVWFDLLKWVLELLDLEHRWVGKCGN